MASTRRPERPSSSDADREELWKPMLDSISSGKRLPEKSLLVLGGTPDSQRDFLDAVDPQPRARRPPVANQFALGYTYHDVLDSDHEDTLARLSLYLLSRPSPAFTPLIRPYLTPRTLPHMLVVILLDWSQPWEWVRQLRDWIRVLRSLILSLDDASKLVLEDNIAAMQATGRPTGPDATPGMDAVKLPLGPGEWDEPLGIPLCVVCQNANKIETLEKERGWNDDEFDFILQYMRTLLLKHGASLIYTMPSAAGSLQTLLHSTLGIKSLLKQEPLRHNVTDRDRVLVPPNWDSWAKIRILRDGFDVEGVSEKWGVDIDIPQHMRPANPQAPTPADADADADAPPAQHDEADNEASATSIYEDTIRNPESDFPLTGLSKQTNGIEVASKDPQTFLTEQVSVLDQLRREDEAEAAQRASRKETEPASRQWAGDDASGVVEEHIGPVQFNMGGIHVNADEMVKRLQDREASRANDPSTPPPKSADPNKMDNDKLMSFFSGLINKGSGSNANSPRGP